MIDVHPPEHSIHGKRDFFVHLFTITIGLLIALGLENAAEAWHHHDQRVEAERTIRAELTQNRSDLVAQDAVLKNEIISMMKVLKYLQARSAGREAAPQGLLLGYSMGQLQDASWRTANATGVVQFIPYDRVELLAEAYDDQAFLESLQRQTLDNYLKLDSYVAVNDDPNALTEDEARSATSDVRDALSHLIAIREVRQGLLAYYDAALK